MIQDVYDSCEASHTVTHRLDVISARTLDGSRSKGASQEVQQDIWAKEHFVDGRPQIVRGDRGVVSPVKW